MQYKSIDTTALFRGRLRGASALRTLPVAAPHLGRPGQSDVVEDLASIMLRCGALVHLLLG